MTDNTKDYNILVVHNNWIGYKEFHDKIVEESIEGSIMYSIGRIRCNTIKVYNPLDRVDDLYKFTYQYCDLSLKDGVYQAAGMIADNIRYLSGYYEDTDLNYLASRLRRRL